MKKRALKLTVKEHMKDVSVSKSSIGEHSWSTGHDMKFSDVKFM